MKRISILPLLFLSFYVLGQESKYVPKIIKSDYQHAVLLDDSALNAKIDRVTNESFDDARSVRLKQISFGVFVTIGLLARLQTEAELALVLSHEFSHYIKEHNLKKVAIEAKFNYDLGPYSIMNGDLDEHTVHKFSKSLEKEADELGMQLFLNCGYNPQAYVGVFDALGRSILPTYKSFEMDWKIPFCNVDLPLDWLPSNVDFSQEEVESEDSDKATHPNLLKRRESLLSIISEREVKDGRDYINIEPQEFSEIRKNAEYTLGSLYLNDLQFYSAYCQNSYLASKYNTHQSKVNVLKSLIGICIARREYVSMSHTGYFSEYEDPRRVKDMFQKMSYTSVSSSTLLSALSLYESDPTNTEYRNGVYTILDVLSRKKRGATLPKSKNLQDRMSTPSIQITKGSLDKVFTESEKKTVHTVKNFFNDPENKSLSLEEKLKKLKKLDLNETEPVLEPNDSMLSLLQTAWNGFDTAIINSVLAEYNSSRNIASNFNPATNLGERYNARYIAYMGLMNYRTLQRKRGENESVYGKLFLFLGAPLAAPQWLSSDILHHYEYQYFSLIYDTKTMKFIALDVDTYKLGLGNEFDESIFLKYNIYNFKQNISSEAK